MSDRKWFLWSLLLAGLICLVVAAANFIVDPQGLNYRVQRAGFNLGKPDPVRFARLGKAYAVLRLAPAGGVFGTSTAEQGLDMQHAAWRDIPNAQNLSFPGASAEEIKLFVEQTHAASKLRRIVIGLDFFSFNAHTMLSPQFYDSLAVMRHPWRAYAAYFSWKMLALSLYTVLQQAELDPSYLPTGQVVPAFLQKWVTNSGGHRRVFLFSERGLVKGLLPLPGLRYDLKKGAEPTQIDLLRGLAEFAQREDIELRFFFTPSHARALEAIRAIELWPMFEYWKQQVVRELEPVMQRSVGKIAVWDFADYNSVTAEPVPPTRDAQSHMRWYWDAQHYKAALGNVMLDRMFGIEVTDASVPPDYGVRVNAGNIDGHLLAVRQRQQAYEATHADEIAEVRANVEKAVQTQQSLRR